MLEPAAVRDIVESSLEAGVNWFDTVEAYGGGASGGDPGAPRHAQALSWLVSTHGDTVVAIPGASSAEQARQNAAAMSLRLNDKELEALTQLSAVPAGASVA